MPTFDIYQVDAFTSEIFKGNPAAVVPLSDWLADDQLLKIAAENNLSETAFFIPQENGFHIRWFTPTEEVDLCGHATLATAWVICNELDYNKEAIRFQSQSGELIVNCSGYSLTLDFPVWTPIAAQSDTRLNEALGEDILDLYHGPDWVAVVRDAQTVRNLKPDMYKLSQITEMRGVIVTAQGEGDLDFVSRFFGPNIGIDEDPVTGSAHCILAPIWSEKLQKNDFTAQQVSQRGGDLSVCFDGDRVYITGQAVLYLKGEIYV